MNRQRLAIVINIAQNTKSYEIVEAIKECYKDIQDYVSTTNYYEWFKDDVQNRISLRVLKRAVGNDIQQSGWHKVLDEAGFYQYFFQDLKRRLQNMHGYYTPSEFAEATNTPQLRHVGTTKVMEDFQDWLDEQDNPGFTVTRKRSSGRGCTGYYVENDSSYVEHAWNKHGDDVLEVGHPRLFEYWISTGKAPKTFLALLDYLLTPEMRQEDAAEKWNTTEMSIRHSKNYLKDIDELPEDIKQGLRRRGWEEII